MRWNVWFLSGATAGVGRQATVGDRPILLKNCSRLGQRGFAGGHKPSPERVPFNSGRSMRSNFPAVPAPLRQTSFSTVSTHSRHRRPSRADVQRPMLSDQGLRGGTIATTATGRVRCSAWGRNVGWGRFPVVIGDPTSIFAASHRTIAAWPAASPAIIVVTSISLHASISPQRHGMRKVSSVPMQSTDCSQRNHRIDRG
jgi:hypothetical protein